MFKTYTIIAAVREGRINKRERIVAEYENVSKHKVNATVNGIYALFGLGVRIDIMEYRFGKCVGCTSNY